MNLKPTHIRIAAKAIWDFCGIIDFKPTKHTPVQFNPRILPKNPRSRKKVYLLTFTVVFEGQAVIEYDKHGTFHGTKTTRTPATVQAALGLEVIYDPATNTYVGSDDGPIDAQYVMENSHVDYKVLTSHPKLVQVHVDFFAEDDLNAPVRDAVVQYLGSSDFQKALSTLRPPQ